MRSPGLSRAPSQGEQLSPAPRNREANAFGACSGVVRDEIGAHLFGIWYLVFDVLPGFHNNIRNVGLHVRR